ncbi:HAD-IIIC family phosphatase [Castellaniella sp.]|uniref:HAD-IIIC family phosphatase n=1 Tax=Castellaniella sp. TaxID=1955812 RepID=UPI002AFFFBAB|nr:HAD-IIIC family phosphatase [Castellaniella sp.]
MLNFDWLPKSNNWGRELNTAFQTQPPTWADLIRLANEDIDFIQTARFDKKLSSSFMNQIPIGYALPPVKIALLGSSTLDHLIPGLRVGAVRNGFWPIFYTPDYGQYVQEILNTASGLHQFKPDTVVCALDQFHLLGDDATNLPPQAADERLQEALATLQMLWQRAHEQFGAQVIQQALLPTQAPLMGHNEHLMKNSDLSLVKRLNHLIREAAPAHSVDILALDMLAEHDGLAAWHDVRLWHRAKQYITPLAGPYYGEHIARLIRARHGGSAKCLVLDLDNTLWGGVIGDDGLAGIILGQGSAEGEAFLAFQRYARALSRRGIILAVCSKNDMHNAMQPFEAHPDMLLQLKDIACFVANWQDKATNLRHIAKTLNIGLDSLVFVDDNPFERNLIRQELPMVRVPELPEDPSFYVDTVAHSGYFESVSLTPEDLQRTAQYQANLQRSALLESKTDLGAYLNSLEMVLEWDHFNQTNLPRIAQLINKSNQFNLTTRRYTEEDVGLMIQAGQGALLSLRLTDRFGDNGIIAVVIALPNHTPTCPANTWRIDTWLMSCRVLGRQVEQATLQVLAQLAKAAGQQSLIGEYLPTAKNSMVAEHYKNLGFDCIQKADDGTTQWCLPLNEFNPGPVPMNIKEST